MNKHLLLASVATVMGFSAAFAADATREITQSGGTIANSVWTSSASPVVTVGIEGGAFVTDIAEANGSIVLNTACATRTVTIASADPAYYVSGFSIDVRGVQKDQVTFTCGNVSVTTPSTDGTAQFAVSGFTAESAVTFTITPNVAENKKAILDNFVVELTATAPSIYEIKENTGWTVSASSITEDNSSVTGPYTYAKAVDGDNSTYWASSYMNAHPHTFCVDMGTSTKVGGFEYMARQDRTADNGVDRLNAYKVYVTEEPVSAYDFSALTPVFEGSLANTQDLQRVEFGANFTGRYFYLQSQSAINANGSESTCFSMAELHLLQGYASQAEVELGAVEQKIEAVKALANAYKENCPYAADAIDGLLANLAQYSAAFISETASELGVSVDEFISDYMITPLEEAVAAAATAAIGTEVTLWQPGQAAFLSARQKSTNQGWNSFNYYIIPGPTTEWTLEAGDVDGQFYLKSIDGTYAATPKQHYVKVVADKAEAAQFTFGAAEGYVTIAPVSLPGTLIGFDGKNDPLEVMVENDGSHGYLWKIAPFEPLSDEGATYCVLGSKRNSGKYLADFNEKVASTLNSTVKGYTGLYCTDQVSANLLWVVTKGYTDGCVFVRNYATGRYLVDFIEYCDSTTIDPVDLQFIDNDGDGIMIHGVAANTNIDANNFNTCVGHWQYGGDGSVWYDEAVDMTKGETVEDALNYHFNVAGVVAAGIRAVGVYRNTLPGSDVVVDEALAKLDALTDPEGIQEAVDAIVKDVTDAMAELFAAVVDDADVVTITNVRRQGLSRPALLAAVTSDDATAFNTIDAARPAALWNVEAGEAEGTYLLYNLVSGKYVGANGAAADEDAAQAFTLTIRDNGTLNFTEADGANLLNIDSGTANLTVWSDVNDNGSQWILSGVDQVETALAWDDVEDYYTVDYKPLTSCSFYVEGTSVEWTGLGIASLWKYENDDLTMLDGGINVDGIEFDAATGKVTIPLQTPMTEMVNYCVLITEDAFAITAEDGSVSYSPYMESNWAIPYYVPDQELALTVYPAAGEVKELGTITFGMGGSSWFDTANSDEKISLSKNDVVIFAADVETFTYNNYDETIGYNIVADQTEKGTYTLVVPARFFATDAGFNATTTVVWTITETGIETVTVTTDGASRVYDLQGRRLNRATRGINIVDGVKTLIRK